MRNDFQNENIQCLSEIAILSLFIKYGDSFIKRLKGSFLIVIINVQDRFLKVFADQLHACPSYYYYTNSLLFLSSSLSEIIKRLRAKDIELQIDQVSIIEYHLFDYTLGNNTFLRNIKETKAGEVITFKNDKIEYQKHYDILYDLDVTGPKTNQANGIEILTNTFKQNILSCNPNPENTAIALTGGYDSRSIAANLGENFKDYLYYSYGRPDSWDIKIPKIIAEKLDLNYTSILFEKKFNNEFAELGRQALMLSDGIGKLSLANYVYVYSNFFPEKTSIITGLFGSELIKRISGPNLAINNNIIQLLKEQSITKTITKQLNNTWANGFFSKGFIIKHTEAINAKLHDHSLINNNLPENRKIFLHFLALSIPKYFQKELKIQSPWIDNKYPFYDIDFIETLLKTPFANIYNWEMKKSLIKNLDSHKLYGALIDQNQELSQFISTHGFKPKHLRKKIYSPLIAANYYRYKKKIKSESGMTYNDLNKNSLQVRMSEITPEKDSIFQSMVLNADYNGLQFMKMFSLFYWLRANGISI